MCRDSTAHHLARKLKASAIFSCSSSRPHTYPYRGTSLIRKRTPLGPYCRPMPRVLGGSYGGGRFRMREVPLYPHPAIRSSSRSEAVTLPRLSCYAGGLDALSGQPRAYLAVGRRIKVNNLRPLLPISRQNNRKTRGAKSNLALPRSDLIRGNCFLKGSEKDGFDRMRPFSVPVICGDSGCSLLLL